MKREFKKGEIINGLTFIKEDFHEKEVCGKQAHRKAVFECFCGDKIITRISAVIHGNVKSCGCIKRNKNVKRFTKHNMSDSLEYATWESMLQRCYNKKSKFYYNYGGRGIKICEQWKNSFSNFFKDMGFKPTPKYSIERIDVNGNYCPENCKWADRLEQDRNRRSNVYIEYNGETRIISDWAKIHNLHPQTIGNRLSRNLPIDKVFNKSYKYVKKNELL